MDIRQFALEVFQRTIGPALVKKVAVLLQAHGIPVMPLKGVLLQQVVYKEETFRQISDVDLLVPAAHFYDAYEILRAAGFSKTPWEGGDWQVLMRKPEGPSLAVDFHRLLSRTTRSRLTSQGMFARGTPDIQRFGAPVVLPSSVDLFAHLLLHASLHFIAHANLHRPQDFQAVADALHLDAGRCADHLRDQGLVTHALVMSPLLRKQTGGAFIHELTARLDPTVRSHVAAHTIQALCVRFPPAHPARRLAGLLLAPSLPLALLSAARDRLAFKGRTDSGLQT